MTATTVEVQPPAAAPVKEPCGPNCGCAGTPVEADFETKLRRVLEKVRPFLQMDGGDIELVAIEDKNALVRLHGACVGCSSSIYTMQMGIDQAIRREIPDFGELIQVD
ncbi:NifU family protein [bacterium]|nr:NifU family protein [bacterium]